jgi:hypothetical protein
MVKPFSKDFRAFYQLMVNNKFNEGSLTENLFWLFKKVYKIYFPTFVLI